MSRRHKCVHSGGMDCVLLLEWNRVWEIYIDSDRVTLDLVTKECSNKLLLLTTLVRLENHHRNFSRARAVCIITHAGDIKLGVLTVDMFLFQLLHTYNVCIICLM